LLTKRIASQLGKSKALGIVIRFMCPVYLVSASARESSFNSVIAGVKWMNQARKRGHQGDISDQISRTCKLVGGTGYIEASQGALAAMSQPGSGERNHHLRTEQDWV
jgi:hypothetical protein